MRSRGGAALQIGGGSHRHRGFPDDEVLAPEARRELVDHAVDVSEVSGVLPLLLGRSDPEEVNGREVRRFVVVGGEAQTPVVDVAAQDLDQSGFVEGQFTGDERRDLRFVHVHTEDFVPEFGHTCCVGGTEIATTENCHLHTLGHTHLRTVHVCRAGVVQVTFRGHSCEKFR